MPPTELRTDRLRLRSWTDADAEAVAAMNADPQVMEHFPALLSRAESDAMFRRVRDHFDVHGFGLWALEPAGRLADALGASAEGPPRVLGLCGLVHIGFAAPFAPGLEIGWRLLPRWWGRGLVTEAAQAALQFGFDTLAHPQIVAFTVPGNARSRAVMARLGMQHVEDGDFEHPRIPEGHRLRRHVLYRLTRQDWRRSLGQR